MFFKKRIHKNIFSFILQKNTKSIWVIEELSRKNRILKYLSGNDEIVIVKGERIFSIKKSLDFLWLNSAGKSIKVDKNNILINFQNLGYLDELSKEKGVFLFNYTKENGNRYFCFYDDLSKKIVWENNISSTLYLLDNTGLFYVEFGEKLEKNIIKGANLFSNHFWVFDTSSFGTFTKDFGEIQAVEVNQLIGVWNKQLIVLLNNGEFIGLNVENGKLLWQKKQVDNNFTKQNIAFGFGLPYHPFLDKKNGVIFILQGNIFIEFNLNTQKASYLWNSKDYEEKNHLFFRHTKLFKDNIYFTASKFPDLGNINIIGVFNIKKREIIWKHTFKFEKGTFIKNEPNSIQVNETNLYLLDSKGTLHIFQKQETTIT